MGAVLGPEPQTPISPGSHLRPEEGGPPGSCWMRGYSRLTFFSIQVARLTHFDFKIIDILTAFIYDTSHINEYDFNVEVRF